MRAISPVIATVIIVSVAIAISIAVALWLTGITSGFTQTENLQIVSAYAVWNTTANNNWNITLVIKNTGTTTATIDNIFINGQPINNLASAIEYPKYYANNKWNPINLNSINIPINPGQNVTISFLVKNTQVGTITFDHGVSLNIKIHTASGRDYPVTVSLP